MMRKSLPYSVRRAMAIAAVEGLSAEDQTVLDAWIAEHTICEDPTDYLLTMFEEGFCT